MKKSFLIFLISLALVSCSEKKKIEGNKIIKNKNEYYLYYDNNIIKLEENTYITTNKRVKDYFKKFLFNNEEQDLLIALKKYFPHGFNGIEKGAKPSTFVEIPVLKIKEQEVIIDAVELASKLSNQDVQTLIEIDETKEEKENRENKEKTETSELKETVNLKDKKIYIYNANGINGTASKLGNKLKEKYQLNFKASNYSKIENGITVINNNLNEAELKEVLTNLNYSNINIEKENLKPDYDLVIIIGKDIVKTNNTDTSNTAKKDEKIKIEVISKSGNRNIEKALKDFNIVTKKDKEYRGLPFSDKTIIRYNKENKNIADKLVKKLLNSSIKEDPNLKNKIVITTK